MIVKNVIMQDNVEVMKKIIALFCFLLSMIELTAQDKFVIAPSLLECKYHFIAIKDTVRRNKQEADSVILRIGAKVSQSFSGKTFFLESNDQDSIGFQILKKKIDWAFASGQIELAPSKSLNPEYLYKNYPEGKITTMTQELFAGFVYQEDFVSQKWAITDSIKQILHYPCRLATCIFRGRTYFAWFAVDIPYHEGPWKFSGLPGLILEVYDINKDYHYTAYSVEDHSLSPITLYNFDKQAYIPTDRVTFLRTRKLLRTGFPVGDIPLLKEVVWLGKKVSYTQRERRHLLYDFLECDY